MAMEARLALRQTQRLVMTPMLQQAIQLLQLSTIELQELLQKELTENPNLYPPAEVMAKLQIFEDLGRDLALYDREWTRIKTAQ